VKLANVPYKADASNTFKLTLEIADGVTTASAQPSETAILKALVVIWFTVVITVFTPMTLRETEIILR
jgi:hypothetical protein